MSIKERFLNAGNITFFLLLLAQLLPDTAGADPQTSALLVVAAAIEVVGLIAYAAARERSTRNIVSDVSAVVFVVLLLWSLTTAKYGILPEKFFPAPGIVFAQIAADAPKIAQGVVSSLGIIAEGFIGGGLSALVLGLLLGWHSRVNAATEKVVAFLSAIPPIVYIPYGIALLPTFHSASVMVIFLATFWPVLTGTLAGVSSVDQRAIDSARVLNVKTPEMIFKVILPGALPMIFNGFNMGLCLSFILLTSAEMIGGSTGMGYYVRYYSDFGDYTRILAGIIVIGVVITTITVLFGKLQRHLTRWK